jgi:hypothetical protein
MSQVQAEWGRRTSQCRAERKCCGVEEVLDKPVPGRREEVPWEAAPDVEEEPVPGGGEEVPWEVAPDVEEVLDEPVPGRGEVPWGVAPDVEEVLDEPVPGRGDPE